MVVKFSLHEKYLNHLSLRKLSRENYLEKRIKMTDTTIIDIDLAIDVKDDINFNSDISVPNSDLKTKIMTTPDKYLMRIVKTIGSPQKIINADVVDADFLASNLIKRA